MSDQVDLSTQTTSTKGGRRDLNTHTKVEKWLLFGEQKQSSFFFAFGRRGLNVVRFMLSVCGTITLLPREIFQCTLKLSMYLERFDCTKSGNSFLLLLLFLLVLVLVLVLFLLLVLLVLVLVLVLLLVPFPPPIKA